MGQEEAFLSDLGAHLIWRCVRGGWKYDQRSHARLILADPAQQLNLVGAGCSPE